MQIRRATAEDADAACRILRRSITELCGADHHGDAETLAQWLANKTPDNMRRWIAQTHVFVAAEGERLPGVGAINDAGEIMLNYVAPEARFRGVSKAMLARLESCARFRSPPSDYRARPRRTASISPPATGTTGRRRKASE